jgi:hypothetical protein
VKPTEILLDLNDLKLGRIVKKDFEEVIVDISAKVIESGPAPRVLPKTWETKGAETLPVAPKGFETAPKAAETRLPASPTVFK